MGRGGICVGRLRRGLVVLGVLLLTLLVLGGFGLGRAEAQAPTCQFVDAAALVTAATAQVVTPGGAGTAFYIGDNEWVTAAHVVEGVGVVRLRTDSLDRTATVIGRDAPADLALLRASGAGLTALNFGDHAALRVGQSLGMAGYPVTVSGSPSVTSGLLSKVVKEDGITYLQTDAAANPGNSGGPLFTDCGAVVGVVVAKFVGEAIEGIAWAVALKTVEERLPSLRNGAPPAAAAGPVQTDVRITAQLLADGRVAFGIQERADGGDWSEIQTPARNKFPYATATVDRWLYSSAIPLTPIDGRAAGPVQIDVRITAQLLADGRVAFGIQERADGGDWSEIRTPSRNKFPYATATVDRWLYSSAIPLTPLDDEFNDGANGNAPVLEITAICNQWWDATAETWQKPETADACHTGGANGLRTGPEWHWFIYWTGNIKDAANVVHRFDGGPAFSYGSDGDRAAFAALAPGQHTLEVREQRPEGWTAWSAPYTFTIFAPSAPLEITAFCNWSDRATVATCRAGAGDGLDPTETWYLWYVGVEDWDNAYLSLGGSGPISVADFSLRGLPPGEYTLQLNEWRSAGWAGWSAPHPFTIRADDRATVVDWLWGRYEHVGDEYDRVGAIMDGAHDGVYSYGYAADLLFGLFDSLRAWGDELEVEPLPALHGDPECTLARNWIALSGKSLALLAGTWGLSFREFPYGDYSAELREKGEQYFNTRGDALDAIRYCESGR